MVNQLTESIEQSFAKSVKLLVSLCESEIEKIFLLKVLDYVLKRPKEFSVGFIFIDTDTETIDGVEYIDIKNSQLQGLLGFLGGLRINNLIKKTYLEIYPQKEIEYCSPDNIFQIIDYSGQCVQRFRSKVCH